MSEVSVFNSVREYLASRYMYVDDEWLTGCIEYLSEDSSKNYSVSDIQRLAKEQWLLNDLKDICPGSLPANLKKQKKTVLSGRYVVQINAAIDIGTPAYQQYLKLQNINQENIEATTYSEEKIRNNRLMKLYLTDGVQELSGIEYKPMRNLSTDITPGCKALLKGPIECRRGVLLLSESTLELIGGEVQEMAANCLPGLIAAKLNLPVPDSGTTDNLNTTKHQNNTITSQRHTDLPRPHAEMPSARPLDLPRPHAEMPSARPPDFNVIEHSRSTTEMESSRPVARVTSLQVANSFADDDIDIEQIAAIEAELANNHSADPSVAVVQPNVRQDSNKRPSTETHVNPEKKIKMVNTADDYPTDEDLFMEDEDHLKDVESQCDKSIVEKNQPIKVSAEPFTYIKIIKDLPSSETVGKVLKIKGQIIKLLSKLSIRKEGWSLKCTIVDGTGALDVDFTSEVLTKIVGYSPEEMNQLKKEIAKNPELKEQAVNALLKAKNLLQVLYCIIEVTMSDTPKITRLIPFGETHLNSLKKRAEQMQK